MRKWIRRMVIVVVLASFIGATVLALRPEPVGVDVVAVSRGDLRITVDEEAKTRVKDRYVVTAPLAGNLARVELRAGDRVETTTVLARIEPIDPPLIDARTRNEMAARAKAATAARRQAKASVARARAALRFATRESERLAELVEGGSASRAELELKQLEKQTASQQLESAVFGERVALYEQQMTEAALGTMSGSKKEGEQLEIVSPIRGVVLRVLQQSEGPVVAGTPILEVADPQALEIVADILTSDAIGVEPGHPVDIRRWGGEGELHGRVRRVEPAAFTKVSALGVEEQRVNVIIDLTDPSERWARLGDGYRVEVAIEVWSGHDVVKVPSSALFRRADGWAVFVLRPASGGDAMMSGGSAEAALREVKLGRRSGLEVEILDGLSPDERVVVHPSDEVADSVAVTPR